MIERIEHVLEQPLEAEQTADELERARRRRIAEENQAAQQKLGALLTMPRGRRLA